MAKTPQVADAKVDEEGVVRLCNFTPDEDVVLSVRLLEHFLTDAYSMGMSDGRRERN